MAQSALCRAITGMKCNVNYFTIQLLPHGWNQIITVTNVCILYNLLKINKNNKSKIKLVQFFINWLLQKLSGRFSILLFTAVLDNETKLYFAVVSLRILDVIALAAGSISSFAIVCGVPVLLSIMAIHTKQT
jgi:hypothetical protein